LNSTAPLAFQRQSSVSGGVSAPGSLNGQPPTTITVDDPLLPSQTLVSVVSFDQLAASATQEYAPLAKSTDDSGKKSVGMLTPEEATRKLRRNEESYLVGRGKGVVRYDLVQLPSNDPIEDDHAEKIVEVPPSVAGTQASDWMFWGVFDGHS
jgi:pyruvate dehydrogenase phosphatase